jgi:hypothetical protein
VPSRRSAALGTPAVHRAFLVFIFHLHKNTLNARMADMDVDTPVVKKEGKEKEGKQRFEVKKVFSARLPFQSTP